MKPVTVSLARRVTRPECSNRGSVAFRFFELIYREDLLSSSFSLSYSAHLTHALASFTLIYSLSLISLSFRYYRNDWTPTPEAASPRYTSFSCLLLLLPMLGRDRPSTRHAGPPTRFEAQGVASTPTDRQRRFSGRNRRCEAPRYPSYI